MCLHLVRALDIFSSDLLGNLGRFVAIGDPDSVWMVWSCCVVCLAHLAALYHFMSQTDPAWSSPMKGLYGLTLDKLGNLSLEVRVDVYSHFDFLTGVRVPQ